MPSESVKRINAMLRRPRPVYAIASDGAGRARFVPLAMAGDAEPDTGPDTPRRVADGTADGGKGRQDPPRPAPMNALIQDLAFGAYARKLRDGG
jgi:hypothetical protein